MIGIAAQHGQQVCKNVTSHKINAPPSLKASARTTSRYATQHISTFRLRQDEETITSIIRQPPDTKHIKHAKIVAAVITSLHSKNPLDAFTGLVVAVRAGHITVDHALAKACFAGKVSVCPAAKDHSLLDLCFPRSAVTCLQNFPPHLCKKFSILTIKNIAKRLEMHYNRIAVLNNDSNPGNVCPSPRSRSGKGAQKARYVWLFAFVRVHGCTRRAIGI
nr:MAG TPA: hypothetical protein [Caudoviricetes sp.]